MRPIILSLSFMLALGLCAIAQETADQKAEPATQPADTPFWEEAITDLDLSALKPAPVKLTSAPDTSRALAVLQLDGTEQSADYQFPPGQADEDVGYRIAAEGLKVDAALYGDRTYKITKIDPLFSGLTLLQTKCSHKAICDGRYGIVLSTEQPCFVFIALDERAIAIYKEHGAPPWLQEFRPTGHKLFTDDQLMAQTQSGYLILVKKALPGKIVLGPASMSNSANTMYFAFFAAAK